ncbi:hypothetical protein I5677_06600 [Mobilitalea sibirica]|uniref:Uncharacterized protein n=1 Tax=Mobilitalea sibirica TaxID=1462919 RepID=A0A8J7HC13_9FIRM|nr:hypothetical protein [Mobilitalea sibirica]MBH1940552.1 hypothetical protein [Mobilitalea sibirica]
MYQFIEGTGFDEKTATKKQRDTICSFIEKLTPSQKIDANIKYGGYYAS